MIDEENDDGLGGRSRHRREVNASRRYGATLIGLDPDRLADVPMSDELREAIALGRRIDSPIAKKRQILFIEKLLRNLEDDEIVPIERLLAAPRQGPRADRTADREADALLASDDALAAWVAAHPGADVQRLRTLIRNARKDAKRRGALVEALRTR